MVVTNTDGQSGTLNNGYTYTRRQSGADGDFDHAEQWNGERRDGGDHHRHGLPGGSDGESGRHGGDGRDGGEQHVDHGHDCRRTRRAR